MNRPIQTMALLAASLGLADGAYADGDEVMALREQLAQLKLQVQMLEEQVTAAVAATASPPEPDPPVEWVVESDPVVPDSVVHLAGYGAVSYADVDGQEGSFGELLFAPIFHYQYKDLLLFEGELEVEVGQDGETEVALEYVTLDLMLGDNATLVAGKFLSPIGQFRQNLHPSWINKLPGAPPGFGHDEAAPLADVGFQLRGGMGLGSGSVNYALFASNGPRLEIEAEEEEPHDKVSLEDEEPGEFEIHGLESEGFVDNEDGELVFGGRVGFVPWPNLEVGLSAATGKVGVFGEEGLLVDEPVRDLDVFGADFYYARQGFQFRGEYVTQEVARSATSVVPDSADWTAWYAQASYRWPKSKFETVVRYADFGAVEADDDREQLALGLNYLFANQVIGKLAYERNDAAPGSAADGDRVVMQLAYGF